MKTSGFDGAYDLYGKKFMKVKFNKSSRTGYFRRYESVIPVGDLADFESAVLKMAKFYFVASPSEADGDVVVFVEFKKAVQSYVVEDIVGSRTKPVMGCKTKSWVEYQHRAGYALRLEGLYKERYMGVVPKSRMTIVAEEEK